MSVADLPLNEGDFLLIDSSFKPSRGVIATPRSARLPTNFSSYARAHRFYTFRAPFVQVCYTDATGKYRISTFTGKKWSTEVLLFDKREVMFSVFVNNHLLRKDQNMIMIKKVNDEIAGKKRIELSETQQYEGWFRLS
jgi:hypothetical protein